MGRVRPAPWRPWRPPPRERRPADRGAVAVEFALLFPLLFFLLFGTLIVGWRVWEHQAGQATAREAARLASLGIGSLDDYRRQVVCLGEHNGLRPGALTALRITLFDRTLQPAADPTYGGYVEVVLTYRSTFGAVAMITSDDGTFTASGLDRIEQTDGLSGRTLAVNGERCP